MFPTYSSHKASRTDRARGSRGDAGARGNTKREEEYVCRETQRVVRRAARATGLNLGLICLGQETLPVKARDLAAEAVERAALALERVDDVHSRDGLPARVLGVGHRIADAVLKEDLKHAAGLLVDEARDALHAATAGKAADRRLGDALDVVAKDLAVALGAALAETLATLSTARHV
jgi:hypothetical protein